MGLKRLWMRVLGKAKKPSLARVEQRTHSIEPTATPLLRSDAAKSKTTDDDNVIVNDHGSSSLQKTNQLPPSPSTNVALQVGQYPMPLGSPLPDFRNSYQYTSPIGASNHWRKIFTLKNLTRRSQHHHGLKVDPCLYLTTKAVDANAAAKSENSPPAILSLNRQRQPSQPHNKLPNQPLIPTNEKETAEDLSHETRSERLSVKESEELVVDASHRALQLRKDDPRMTRMDEVQVDHKFYRIETLPEIPSEEMISELEPEEVILYPRKDELEALRQQYPSPPPVEKNNEAQHSLSPLPEGLDRPLVGGLLFRLTSAPKTQHKSTSFPTSVLEHPTVIIHARLLELTRRGASQSPKIDFGSPYHNPPSAFTLPALASCFVSAPPGLEFSLRDSLFSSLDMYFKGDSLDHATLHPWNTRFIGQGASGKVFRVCYKPKTSSPIPGVPPIAFGKDSEMASVKIIEMKKQTEGTLLGLASEVIALKLLKRKRNHVADAKTKGRRGMTYSNGLHYLLESASLPGIDDDVVLRSGRLYLLTKYYHCDLTNYGFKVSNDEKSLAFILSELTQGLNYLHHIGMVHLDLKPSNIFITHDRHCVIGDLGSSIHKPGFIMTNQVGLLVDMVSSYTDGFCAPEIMQSRYVTDRFNCKADFWSLGVTIYNTVRPDGLHFPKDSENEDNWKQRRDYDGMGLGPKNMARMMYDVGCPGRIVNLVLNMCQRDPKKRLGGRGIVKHLREQKLLSNPFDLSPLPDVWIPPVGLPGPETKGEYLKLDVEDACKLLKEHIECKGYNLTMQ